MNDGKTEMPEARAILLGRMGKHEEALKIYVYRLQDYAAAESSVKKYPICIGRKR